MKQRAYIGTYSVRGSKGIYLVEADTGTGALEILDSWPALNPSYLAISGGILYAVLESDEYEGAYGGAAASYTVQPDGSLSLLCTRPAGGTLPCHVCPGPDGETLYVSNYGDGKLSVFKVKNGMLSGPSVIAHQGHGPAGARQQGPHVHCAEFEPGSGKLWVADLGIDKVLAYNTADMSPAGSFAVAGGAGPRHLVFSKQTPFAWLACEISSEVYAFEPSSGKTTGVYRTVPGDYTGRNSCSAIKLSPGGERLYVSNRGHDSIACFTIDPGTGALSLSAVCPTGGNRPRDFAVSPDGAFLYAANETSDNIRVFALEKGIPVDTGLSLDIPSPVCILFCPAV